MIYFDNAATTKPSKTALQKAQIFNEELFYNPSALYHGGLECAKSIKEAKENILKKLSASNYDLIFTSCGTESDNTAIFSGAKRGLAVTDKGEHAAVFKTFNELKNKNVNVEFIDLNSDGSVNTEKLFAFLENNKVDFLSIMHVNNETGAINDINYIAKIAKQINPRLIFHSDGVQAFGKIEYSISNDIDMYSISAHKINGLKGVGALIKKKNLAIFPQIIGGGQENGLRSGTENLFGIKVFEYASNEIFSTIKENYAKILTINGIIKDGLNKELFTFISSDKCSPYVLSVAVSGLRGETIMHSLEQNGIYVGNGSACSSKNRYSRVIEACGYKKDLLDGVIRISFSHENTIEEAKEAVNIINETVKNLKRIIG